MNPLATVCLAVILAFAAVCNCSGEPASPQRRIPLEHTLVGQLPLPPGAGSRGVEVLVRTEPGGGGPGVAWVLFDEHGLISHAFRETVTRVTVTAGAEVYRADAGDLPEVDQAGRIDSGWSFR